MLSLLIALMTTQTFGYWSSGHMIISRIAYEDLIQNSPEVYKVVEKDLKEITQYTYEDKHMFVEAAIWADSLKEISLDALDNWHFVDTPYIMDQAKVTPEYEKMNATWIIDQIIKTLTDKRHPKFDNELSRSFSWRYLLHVVGDLHQPLHATSMYSEKFTHGDLGGNLFKIKFPNNTQITNLHALWDACVNQYGSIYAPLNDTEWDLISKYAKDLTDKYPRESVKDRVSILDQHIWAQESFDLSKSIVYNGIKENEEPSVQYVETGREIVNQQVAIGGYRLADIIRKIYKKSQSGVENILISE